MRKTNNDGDKDISCRLKEKDFGRDFINLKSRRKVGEYYLVNWYNYLVMTGD